MIVVIRDEPQAGSFLSAYNDMQFKISTIGGFQIQPYIDAFCDVSLFVFDENNGFEQISNKRIYPYAHPTRATFDFNVNIGCIIQSLLSYDTATPNQIVNASKSYIQFFINIDASMTNQTTEVIETDSIQSNTLYAVNSVVSAIPKIDIDFRVLTTSPIERKISEGETLRLNMINTTDGANLIIRKFLKTGGFQDELISIPVNQLMQYARKFTGLDNYSYISIKVNNTVVTKEVLSLSIVKKCSNVRVHWLNPYGAIDSYTFTGVQSSSVEAKKTFYITPKGENMQSFSNTSYTYEADSENESIETLNWLSYMLSSPFAWVEVNGELLPVNIINKATKLKDKNNLNNLSITYQFSKQTIVQNG